jgi:hypothetical protein
MITRVSGEITDVRRLPLVKTEQSICVGIPAISVGRQPLFKTQQQANTGRVTASIGELFLFTGRVAESIWKPTVFKTRQ